MKEQALEVAAAQTGYNARLNALREYLQAYILRIMHDEGFFRTAAFLGGTALRFLHGLPRFSEDLDFSSVPPNQPDFTGLVKAIKEKLVLAGYDVGLTCDEDRTVKNAWVKFAGLAHEAGISGHRDQKLSVKIELDAKPPAGAKLETMVVNKYFPVSYQTYDLASLFAGKIHALLSRPYAKGRDFFDLGWYLSRWRDLTPNLTLLRNALQQTGWKKELPDADTWRQIVHNTVEKADWRKVISDAQNFLENPADMAILTQTNILKLLGA